MDSSIYLRPGRDGRYKFLFTSDEGSLSGEVQVEMTDRPDTRSKDERDAAARRLIDVLARNLISAARDQLPA